MITGGGFVANTAFYAKFLQLILLYHPNRRRSTVQGRRFRFERHFLIFIKHRAGRCSR